MLIVLMVGSVARAQSDNADPNIDPILPDPVTDGHLFPPEMATATMGDAGPELFSSPISAKMLAGHGPGCGVTSPCAVNSSPLMTLRPIARPKSVPAPSSAGG